MPEIAARCLFRNSHRTHFHSSDSPYAAAINQRIYIEAFIDQGGLAEPKEVVEKTENPPFNPQFHAIRVILPLRTNWRGKHCQKL